MYERTLNSISTQLSASSNNLTVFGIFFAIIAIILGVYVTHIERTIEKIREENKDLRLQNKRIKQDVVELNELIQSDIYGLYLRIKREKTVHIITRLVNVPRDVHNFMTTLLTTDFKADDFVRLKQAYVNLDDDPYGNYGTEYLLVFFQHFFGFSLMDETLRKPMQSFIPDGIHSSFKNDMVKSMEEFAQVLVNKGAFEYKEELNFIFKGLSESSYRNFTEVYSTFFKALRTRKIQFEVFDAIELKEARNAKISFGNLLLEQYGTQSPDSSEQLSFLELQSLVSSQHLQDEKEAQEKARLKELEEEATKRV